MIVVHFVSRLNRYLLELSPVLLVFQTLGKDGIDLVLKLQCALLSPKGHENADGWASFPVSDSADKAQEFVFLTSFQVVLMLWVQTTPWEIRILHIFHNPV